MNRLSCGVALLVFAATSAASDAQVKPRSEKATDASVLASIRDAATSSDWSYQRLTELADRIGPRLSGSRGAEAAVTQVAQALRAIGAKVVLQPCKVPHWVRGEERGELIEYPGRPQGITQHLHLTALGGSAATPAEGLSAPVMVIHDFAELVAKHDQVPGAIVVFEEHFSQMLAERGFAGTAYGEAVEYRVRGPAAAAAMGAVAVLVRSVGGADYRLPHTGFTQWEDGQAPIPAGALSTEDADLIGRLAAQGPVTLKLVLTPQTLPDVDSYNVIADIPGREHPEQVVIVSGHLDSWDLGTGAIDDGMGLTAAMGVAEVLQRLGLHPRRTVRIIAWMNEENGSAGSEAYFESVKNTLDTQTAAIESDFGLGTPLGISAALFPPDEKKLGPVFDALRPLGATAFELRKGDLGADIGPLLKFGGVPEFAPIVDVRHYFDYHHTAADTLDKIDPADLQRQVAVLAVLAYHLADMPEPLARLPPVVDSVR